MNLCDDNPFILSCFHTDVEGLLTTYNQSVWLGQKGGVEVLVSALQKLQNVGCLVSRTLIDDNHLVARLVFLLKECRQDFLYVMRLIVDSHENGKR